MDVPRTTPVRDRAVISAWMLQRAYASLVWPILAGLVLAVALFLVSVERGW